MQVFVSLLLVLGSVILFVHTVRQRSFDHADRLALLPVGDEERVVSPGKEAPVPSTEGKET